MSSKRGRKRNDNLPPNRARDVQRAFRARRAAHLEALEQRVTELEQENDTLRAALHLPPANRLPLGKGPTGKDKPKPRSPPAQAALSSILASSSTASSSSSSSLTPSHPSIPRNESPSSASTRTHSLSPANLNVNLHPSPQQPSAGMDWEEAMMVRKDRPENQQSAPASQGYPITPVSANQTHASYTYPPASASTTRHLSMAQVYMQPLNQPYPQAPERQHSNDVYPEGFVDRRYPYSQPTYSNVHDSSQMHHPIAHSPAPNNMQSIPSHRGNANIQQPISYAHRRSVTEPQGYRPVVINQSTPPLPQHAPHQHHHAVRIPSPIGMADENAPLRAVYDIEPRVGRMS